MVARIDELRQRLTESFSTFAQSASVDKEGQLSCALSGGATALIFLGALKNANVDWSRISLFWADERAVPATDPESNYGVAERMLLSPLGGKAPRAFPMTFDFAQAKSVDDTLGASSLGTAAMKYDALLAHELKSGSLDLALLGVGEDGHICSLFPGHRALLADDLRVVAVEDAPAPAHPVAAVRAANEEDLADRRRPPQAAGTTCGAVEDATNDAARLAHASSQRRNCLHGPDDSESLIGIRGPGMAGSATTRAPTDLKNCHLARSRVPEHEHFSTAFPMHVLCVWKSNPFAIWKSGKSR